MTLLESIQEAERRGLTIPPDKQALIDKARRRGLVAQREAKDQTFIESLTNPITGRKVIDATERTVTGVGTLVGGISGGVPGAGLLGGGIRQVFRAGEDVLGSLGVEGFKDPNFSLSAPITLDQIKSKAEEAATDILQSSSEEAGGRILTGLPGEVSSALVGAGVGALVDDKDMARGALIGATVGGLGAGLFKRSGITNESAKKIAVKEFKEATVSTPNTQAQIDKNILEGSLLEDKIGATFARGDISNDASALALQRRLSQSGAGRDLAQAEKAIINQKLDEFYINNVATSGKPSSFIAEVEDVSSELSAASQKATDTVLLEVSRLSRNIDPQGIGRNVLDKLGVPLGKLKTKISGLFTKIPNVKIKTQPMADAIEKVKSEFVQGEPSKFRPAEAIEQIENAIFKEVEKTVEDLGSFTSRTVKEKILSDVPLKRIRGISQTINELIKEANNPTKPNRILARRLRILKNSIDGEFKKGKLVTEGALQLTERSASGESGGIRILREANKLRRSQAIRFEQGKVADVLQRGQRGEETKIALANIASEFNSLDGIDDLSRALGDKEIAKESMSDFFRADLLNSGGVFDASTGTLKSGAVNRWLRKNALKLKKLGIFNEFKDASNLQKLADSALDRIDVFNKSVAGRVLKADPDTFIKEAFAGSKNFTRTAVKLMNLTRGNNAAKQGLKKAMALHLKELAEGSSRSFFEPEGQSRFLVDSVKFSKNIKKFQSALRVIYKGDPKKIRALKDAAKGYEIISRSISGTNEQAALGGIQAVEQIGVSGSGAFAPRIGFAVKNINSMITRWGRDNIDSFLRRMVFDPDYAVALMSGNKFNSRVFDRMMVALINQSRVLRKEQPKP